jgi:integrase
MFTIPTIVTSNDLKKKTYIEFYLDNERRRFADGRPLGLKITPNRSKTLVQRDELLEKLRFEFHKALEAGEYPNLLTVETQTSEPIKHASKVEAQMQPNAFIPTEILLKDALTEKLSANLSRTYKRDLVSIHKQFIEYLTTEELSGSIEDLSKPRVQKFLSRFGSSGTYYMNKRRNLGVIVNAAAALIDKPVKTVKTTTRRKAKAKLHEKYERQQLKPILDYLKIYNPNLYICCLLTYSSWLRPHEEIRLLTTHNFKKNLTEVHLTGDDNKGGQVRVVHIPEYVRAEISSMLIGLERTDNIFSRSTEPFNYSYFNTQWSRAYVKLKANGLVHEEQTIYSFRHTAAVEVYRKTKDVYLLQKLLGHSSIVVTLKYLRTLGELNSDEMKQAAPTLDFA